MPSISRRAGLARPSKTVLPWDALAQEDLPVLGTGTTQRVIYATSASVRAVFSAVLEMARDTT